MTDDCWSGENSRTPSSPSHPFSLKIDTNLPLNTFFFFYSFAIICAVDNYLRTQRRSCTQTGVNDCNFVIEVMI